MEDLSIYAYILISRVWVRFGVPLRTVSYLRIQDQVSKPIEFEQIAQLRAWTVNEALTVVL